MLAMLPMFMGGMDAGGGPPPDIAGLINGITSCLGDEVHMVADDDASVDGGRA